jgi:hypothetical protein
MGIFDKAKDALGDVTEKAEGLRENVGHVVENVVDKAADAADQATKGKYSDKIDKVRELADKIDGESDDEPTAGGATEA